MTENRVVRLARLFVGTLVMLLTMQGAAFAATLVYYPNDPDLDDLEHQYVYTWRITNINTSIPSGHTITGAYLFFDNIRNWDPNPNKLFMHLLDTSLNGGTALTGSTVSPGNTSTGADDAVMYARKLVDDPTDTVIRDQFAVDATKDYYSVVNPLVADGTENTPLGANGNGDGYSALFGTRQESWAKGNGANSSYSFSMTAMDYQYDFDAAQILKLTQYIANGGDIAFGLDPDCHFFNDGISFVITTTGPQQGQAVPEPASLTLLGLGLSGLYARRRRAARQAQNSVA